MSESEAALIREIAEKGAPARPVEDRPDYYERQVRAAAGTPPAIVPDPPAAELLGVADIDPGRIGDPLPHLVCGPDDHVLIRLAPNIDHAQLQQMLDVIRHYHPDIANRVLVVAAEQVVVIEG